MKSFALAAAALLLVGCSSAAAPAATGTAENPPATETATTAPETTPADNVAVLKVTTTGAATITWGTTGGTSQDEIKKDWTKEVELGDFDVVTVSVVGTNFQKAVSVSCEILIGGESKVKNAGKGKLASANCTANTTD